MNKVLVDIYYTYGKGDGEELCDRFIIDLAKESREDIFDRFQYDESYDDKEAFLKGEIDIFSFVIYGGDWDDPTGGYVVINSKDELIDSIKRKADQEIAEVEKMFEAD